MKKSKKKLLFSFLIILSFIYIINIIINNKINTIYNIKTNSIEGIIEKYEIDGNKLKLELKAKELIICSYYFDTLEELNKYKKILKLGIKIKVTGTINYNKNNSNFNLFNYNKYLYSKKIFWSFKIDEIKITNNKISFLYNIKNYVVNRIDKQETSTYLKLFILGDYDLEENINDSFRINGISHLFSVSGMNIVLFIIIIEFIMNKIFKNNNINILVVFIVLMLYVFLTNFSIPVMRAVYFYMLMVINKIFKLKISNLKLFILLLILFLIYNPYYIYNIGFLFTFFISLCLITFGSIINNYKSYLGKTLVTSYISFLISVPIVINNFFSINLLSPLINIFFVPFVSFIIFPLSLLNFIIPFFSILLIPLINLLESISLFCSKIDFFVINLSHINLYFFILYYIVIILIIYKLKYKKYGYVFIFLLMVIVHSNIHIINKYPIVTMIDVGQGDSLLIELPHNKGNILIDTGGFMSYSKEWQKSKNTYSLAKQITIPYLKSIGINNLDYLVLTHGDADHMGEAINIISNFKVKNIIINSGSNNSLEKNLLKYNKTVNIKKVSEYTLLINGYKFYFINKKYTNSENKDSLVIYTVINNKKILLMGDADIEVEKELIKKYNLYNIDILKVGHHGSKTSSGDEFIKKTKPSIALISVGLKNKFGHPSGDVIKKLKKINTKIYLTSINGMTKLILKNNIKIKNCIS